MFSEVDQQQGWVWPVVLWPSHPHFREAFHSVSCAYGFVVRRLCGLEISFVYDASPSCAGGISFCFCLHPPTFLHWTTFGTYGISTLESCRRERGAHYVSPLIVLSRRSSKAQPPSGTKVY